jgi:hypothetical protein
VWQKLTLAILTTWIGDPEKDAELEAKGALGELRSASLARLGVALPDDGTNGRMRAITARFVLVNEFRSDLEDKGKHGPAVALLNNVPEPATADQQKTVREVAKRLRERHPTAYVDLADGIENELGLSAESVEGSRLGAIDTFRFEEAAVVAACFGLIASEKFSEAGSLLASRDESFWVNLDVGRDSYKAAFIRNGWVTAEEWNELERERNNSPTGSWDTSNPA